MNPLFTIGHSNHPAETVIGLLAKHEITAVADVRSNPYSKFNPQFNRETLQETLKQSKLAYVFLGKELGPRSKDPSCYENGKASYEKLARTALFQNGLQRLENGLKSHKVAVMCSEKDPIFCHRMILVCKNIRNRGWDIFHILEDGSLETLGDAEKRLLKHLKIPELQLFESPEDLILRAYKIQAEKIAFQMEPDEEML